MSKELTTPLEALEMVDLADVHIGKNATMPFYKTKQYRIIETALKALEIIIKKKVNIGHLLSCIKCEIIENPLSFYNEQYEENRRLTQEELDLLKEVLK
jgi:hypothetical protein